MLYVLNQDKEARKVTQEEFEQWSSRPGNMEERTVCIEKIRDLVISTVFLCLDYGTGIGEPELFETAVMQNAAVIEYERYPTWEAAEQGHQKVLQQLKR